MAPVENYSITQYYDNTYYDAHGGQVVNKLKFVMIIIILITTWIKLIIIVMVVILMTIIIIVISIVFFFEYFSKYTPNSLSQTNKKQFKYCIIQ